MVAKAEATILTQHTNYSLYYFKGGLKMVRVHEFINSLKIKLGKENLFFSGR